MKQTMVFDMQGRGTMTVQRALWQYVRCGDFELATPRLHFPEPGPPLDDAATLAYLHSTVSTKWHPVAVPAIPDCLDALLTDEPLTGGVAKDGALAADGFDGFFSLEPHLGQFDAFGGMCGPELWTVAHTAFTRLLAEEAIAYQ